MLLWPCPDRRLTVYCGHTHHADTAQVLPNFHVVTAAADYGMLRIKGVIDLA